MFQVWNVGRRIVFLKINQLISGLNNKGHSSLLARPEHISGVGKTLVVLVLGLNLILNVIGPHWLTWRY